MSSSRWTRALLIGGTLAAPLFVVVFSILGATRDDYDALRHPVSSLALGPGGVLQRVNFWLTGALFLAGAGGLRRSRISTGLSTRAGPILLSTVGVGLIGAGIFAADPLSGYPPGTPPVGPTTLVGELHQILSTPVFLCLPAAAFVYARAFRRSGRPGWSLLSLLAALAQLATFVLAAVGFDQQAGWKEWAGLFQRVSLVIGLGWFSGLCARTVRRLPSAPK